MCVPIASTDGSNRDYIATLEPLIIQMYASSSVNVLDLDALDCTVFEDLGFSERKIGEYHKWELLIPTRMPKASGDGQFEHLQGN